MELTMRAWLFREHAFTISTNICNNEMIKERTCPGFCNSVATESNWPCVGFVNLFNIYMFEFDNQLTCMCWSKNLTESEYILIDLFFDELFLNMIKLHC